MDYRLTEEVIKRAQEENSLIIRNAGANVFEIRDTLKKLNPEKIIYLPHTDCAAMKLTYSVLKNGEKVTPLVSKNLISVFKDRNFNSTKELEEINAKVNEEMIREILPNAKIIKELVDVSKIKWPERKAKVYVLKADKKYDNNIIGYYIIQAITKEDILADLEIADKLGLKIEKSDF
jgi:carbonic anhydrase